MDELRTSYEQLKPPQDAQSCSHCTEKEQRVNELETQLQYTEQDNNRLHRLVVQRFFDDVFEDSDEWPPFDWTEFEDFDLFGEN